MIHINNIKLVQSQSLVKVIFIVGLHVIFVFKRVQIVIKIVSQRVDEFGVKSVVVDESNDPFQLADMAFVVENVVVEFFDLAFA